MLGVEMRNTPTQLPNAPDLSVLNKSVLGAGTHDPLLAARLAGECKQIERMSAGLAKRLFTLPWLTVPPIGCAELSKLVRSPTSSAASDTNHSGIH